MDVFIVIIIFVVLPAIVVLKIRDNRNPDRKKINFFSGSVGTIVWIIGAGVGYVIGKEYPAVLLQLLVAYILYWLGKKLIKKYFVPDPLKDESRKKAVYILSGLGLLGLISPVLGFIFVLPAYLISTELITPDYKNKKMQEYISGAVGFMCLLNAASGVILNQLGII